MQAQAWVTLWAALGAFAIAIFTLAQKHRADNRKEWWTRFQWALALTMDESDASKMYGWRVLDDLSDSGLATATEAGLVEMLTELRMGRQNWANGEEGSDE